MVLRTALAAWTMELRRWQQAFFEKWVSKSLRDFLLVATPGSGKTIAALRVLHHLLATGKTKRVVIVTPTENLKSQWAIEAARFGIHLDPEITNRDGGETADFHGVVVTYQAVAASPGVHRILCSRAATVVILDEVHHAGTGKELRWGDALREAFGDAAFRLSMSGTPFRNDNNCIPFVTYVDGKSKADDRYEYGDALTNGDCRLVLFPHYEGKMKWSFDGIEREATFRDELTEREASQRLRTALDPSGGWLSAVLKEANQKLNEVRHNGHPAAAGLVITRDKVHAAAVAFLLHRVTGEKPVVVTSEDAEANEKIRSFKTGTSAWIVAIKMVSEGVDIPRLRVGVYATNIISEMFFRQFVGRFVRVIFGLEEQTGYIYIPAEEQLVMYAQLIKEERDHHLLTQADETKEPKQQEDREDGGMPLFPPVFLPESSEAQFSGTIHENDLLSPVEIAEGRNFLKSIGIRAKVDDLDTVRIFRASRGGAGQQQRQNGPQPEQPQQPRHEERNRQKSKTNNLMRVFAMSLSEAFPESDRSDIFKLVNTRIYRETGSWLKDATIEVLQKQLQLVGKWLNDFRKAAKQGQSAVWVEMWQKNEWAG